MSHFILRFFSLLLCASVLQSGTAPGQSKLGGLPGAAARMGFGARGMSHANALTAVRSGEISGYYNPALVPFQAVPTGFVSTALLSLDRYLNFLCYSRSLKPSGGISLGIINAGVSNLEGRNRDGVRTGTYKTSENVFLFSFGSRVSKDISIGVSAKVYYYSLFESVQSTTAGFDLGVLYLASEEITLGAVVQDINAKYRWDTGPLYGRMGNNTVDRYPLRKRLAASYAPFAFGVAIAAEVELIGSTVLTRIGSEVPLLDGVTVRGGVDQISLSGEVTSKPSLGFSVQTPIATWKPALHYGYIHEPYAPGGIHVLSVVLHFE